MHDVLVALVFMAMVAAPAIVAAMHRNNDVEDDV
jgi:hypothetical protein